MFLDMDANVDQRQDRRAKYLRKGGCHIARPHIAVGDRVWVQDNHTQKWDINTIVKIVRDSGWRCHKVQCI